MYATESDFLIIQNEGSGGAGPLSVSVAHAIRQQCGFDCGAKLSSVQRRDAAFGYGSGFQGALSPKHGSIQSSVLNENPSNEEAYKLYKKNIKIGYDPTEGMIRMEVVAADPEISAEFSRLLIAYAQARVNDLSQEKRDDQMSASTAAYEKSLKARRDAQEALIKLQVENGVDPQAVIASIRTQITNYETLLIEKELELAALLDNNRPNRAKVEGAEGDVRRLNDLVDRLTSKLNSSTNGENSLAQQAVNLQLAQADLATADANSAVGPRPIGASPYRSQPSGRAI